ncbi:phage-related minor tail protein [Rhizobium aquaticum]|uniref:Phage-related minor tail protein n=1 Tax=Rhizobium aquaticum TaxID=1549636 RepID=A0ABV2IY27_9HYPH
MTDPTSPGGPGSLDTAALDQAMTQLEARSKSFGAALSSALKSASVDGKSLEDVLKGLAHRLTDIALSAGTKPLENLVNSAAGSLASTLTSGLSGGLSSLLGFAKGGVPGAIQPFAAGGVVSAPTYFPTGGGIGLMGEAGSEAILPLKRGPDGRLGVAAGAGGGGGQTIVFNVSTPDAGSFRKSEAQISAMLTRATARGRRGV